MPEENMEGEVSGQTGGSGGGGAAGARGVDSSGYTPGENLGARYLRDFPIRKFYEEEVQGRRGQSYKSNQGGQQSGTTYSPHFFVAPSTEEDNMTKECNFYPGAFGAPWGGYGYGGMMGNSIMGEGCLLMNAISNVNANVKESESDVKDAIMESNSQRQAAELNLHNRLCDSEKAAINAGSTARLETKDAFNALSTALEKCCCENREMVMRLETNMNEKFCDLERRQDKEFDRIREREDKREIATLKEDKALCLQRDNNRLLAKEIVDALLCAGLAPTPVAAAHAH